MNIADRLIAEALELEKRAKAKREIAKTYTNGEKLISIGTIILDTDANKLAKVTKIKNGSNDFEAEYLDGTYGRGYSFIVRNWKVF